jgi:hypothetical protein
MLPELTREGFSEGRNLVLDVRSGPPEQLKALAGELVAHRPDAILAVGTGPVIAAREATTAIPIVIFGADRLLSQRDTLSRPSGNATGFVIFGPELDAKRLHLLHEITEADRPIAALLPRGIGGVAARHAAIEAAAAVLRGCLETFGEGGWPGRGVIPDGCRSQSGQPHVDPGHPSAA